MKNSKNKILAAVICGIVAGSVGTSFIGNFQKDNAKITASNNVSSHEPGKSEYDNNEGSHNGRGKNKRGGHHIGEVSLENTESIDMASESYEDGTYEGTANGYGGNLKVQVKVSSGKIENIEVVSHNETPGFSEKAFESVPAEIVKKQSTDVDTVSGATYSSKGIINAVNNALNS